MRKMIMTFGFSVVALLSACGLYEEGGAPNGASITSSAQALSASPAQDEAPQSSARVAPARESEARVASDGSADYNCRRCIGGHQVCCYYDENGKRQCEMVNCYAPQQESVTEDATAPSTTIGVHQAGRTFSLSIQVRDAAFAKVFSGGVRSHQAESATATLTDVLQRMVDSGKLDPELYQGRTLTVDRDNDTSRCWRVYDCECDNGRCVCVFVGTVCA